MAGGGSACYQRDWPVNNVRGSPTSVSPKDGSVQVLFLSLLLAAEEPRVRPDTYTVNPRYSTGPIENFRDVYVDPAQAPAQLKPSEAQGGTSDLSIRNEMMGWTEVTVGGTKIGTIDSLTTGVVRGVPAGTYEVVLRYSNGFEKKLRVSTMTAPAATTTAATTAPPPPAGDEQKTQ
jgi:hypothetical protein